jgi:hypothetical protein
MAEEQRYLARRFAPDLGAVDLTPVGDPTSQRELDAGELLGFGGPKLELVLRGV